MDPQSIHNHNHNQKYFHIIHESSSSSSPQSVSHSSHASFPIIAVAIIGIFATIFLLVFYYIFVIKCCLNWHRIDILRRFSLSRNRNNQQYPLIHHNPNPNPSLEPKGLHESVIRAIPIFHFQKLKDSNSGAGAGECAVCLAEFEHDEKLRIIPNCAHVFHIDCIDVWLQNNPNCPLCRTSISVSIPTHFPVPDQQLVSPNEEDYVVIELGHEGRNDGGEDDRPNSGEPIPIPVVTPSPRKKPAKVRKKHGHVSSMGDECIDVTTQFSVQPIRRSFSMDSASDRQLYLAVQDIIQRNAMNHMNHVDVLEVSEGCSSNNGGSILRRGLFSFGHARSAVLPFRLNS